MDANIKALQGKLADNITKRDAIKATFAKLTERCEHKDTFRNAGTPVCRHPERGSIWCGIAYCALGEESS